MLAKKRFSFSHFFLLLLALVCVLAVFFRTPFGVDVTDESFYCSEPYLLLHGSVPYASNWSQTPLTFLLTAPVIWLYTTLTGGTDGLFLFSLYAGVVFRLLISFVIWRLLRQHIDERSAALSALILFCCNMGHTRGLNYNVLSLYLLALAGTLLFHALSLDEPSRASLLSATAGVTMALCALAHASQLVNCVLLGVVLLLDSRKKPRDRSLFLHYILAGLAVAFTVVLGLELASNWSLFSGLLTSLRVNNYYRIPHLSIVTQLLDTKNDITVYLLRHFLPAFGACLAPLLLFFSVKRRSLHRAASPALLLSLIGGTCLYLLWLTQRRGDVFSSDYAAFCLFLLLPLYLFWMASAQKRVAARLLITVALPCLSSLLITAAASHAPANYRYYILTFAAALTVPLASLALQTCFAPNGAAQHTLRSAPVLLLGTLFCTVLLVNLYTNVYRDAPIIQQTGRVESGFYRGCRTTPERSEAIQRLERTIASVTLPGKRVLIADLFPAGYLSSRGIPFTPTTWDPSMSRYGFKDMTIFQAYFEKQNAVPDMILFVKSEEDSPLSIDDPDNEWSQYIREHYTQTAVFGKGMFSMRVFEKTTP